MSEWVSPLSPHSAVQKDPEEFIYQRPVLLPILWIHLLLNLILYCSFLYLISLESIPLVFQHFSLSHLKAHMPRSLTSLPTISSVQPTTAAADNPGHLLSQGTTKFFYDTTQKGLKYVTSLHAHGYFPKAKQPLPVYFKYRNTLVIKYPQIHSSPLFTLQPKQAHFGKLPNPNFNFFICKVLFFRLYRIVAKIK